MIVVAVVYVAGTSACEAEGKGSTPFGHPSEQRIESKMSAKMLNRPVLVLNRNWQPVNVATVARAFVMLWNESARVVDPADYRAYSWEDWSKLRSGGDCARRLRSTAGTDRRLVGGCRLQSPEHLQAGPLHVPVLRPPARELGADDRPRSAPLAGRSVLLGELRAGLPAVQRAKG